MVVVVVAMVVMVTARIIAVCANAYESCCYLELLALQCCCCCCCYSFNSAYIITSSSTLANYPAFAIQPKSHTAQYIQRRLIQEKRATSGKDRESSKLALTWSKVNLSLFSKPRLALSPSWKWACWMCAQLCVYYYVCPIFFFCARAPPPCSSIIAAS